MEDKDIRGSVKSLEIAQKKTDISIMYLTICAVILLADLVIRAMFT